MKPTPREAKLIHEKYERVVDHLIKEKYAADKESADKIIYMENGKILESGNHKHLLSLPNGKFKKLYEEQFVEELV